MQVGSVNKYAIKIQTFALSLEKPSTDALCSTEKKGKPLESIACMGKQQPMFY